MLAVLVASMVDGGFDTTLTVVASSTITALMVILSLFLSSLPPSSLLLLFFPVGIMAALILLAFSPSEDAGMLLLSLLYKNFEVSFELSFF